MADDDMLDCVVVGGGPAGLTAAIYLARYLRDFIVIDAGEPRAAWIPVSHNYPGFPEGVNGEVLLQRLRDQARTYGARIEHGEVDAVEREGDHFVLHDASGWRRARNVILATGVVDNEPALPDLDQVVRKGLIRICPICDAYEVKDKAVGVLGAGRKVVREAMFLKTYTDDLTVILVGDAATLSDQDRAKLAELDVGLIETSIDKVRCEGDRISAFELSTGETKAFDSIYSAMGTTPLKRLADTIGAETDSEDGCVLVDTRQRTNVEGLYAIGDIVEGLNQIAVAMSGAAIAATDVHNRLRGVAPPWRQPSSA